MLARMTNRFHKKGRKETHFALSGCSDMAICGCDLAGDGDIAGGYVGMGLTPDRKVDCPDCRELYEAIVGDFKAKGE